MKPTDFSKYLTEFLASYLPGEKGASVNTIKSYRDTFVLFLQYFREELSIPAEKLMLEHIDKDTVIGFLSWIENAGVAVLRQGMYALQHCIHSLGICSIAIHQTYTDGK